MALPPIAALVTPDLAHAVDIFAQCFHENPNTLQMNKNDIRTIIIGMDDNGEQLQLEKALTTELTHESVSQIIERKTQYILSIYKSGEHENNEKQQTQNVQFIYMCTTNCKTKQKMLYSTMKAQTMRYIKEKGVPITRNIEVDSVEDLEHELNKTKQNIIMDKPNKFSKPAAPGKRRLIG